MEDETYEKILDFLQNNTMPEEVSSASNWRRFAGKFTFKLVRGKTKLYRVFENEDEEKVERIVLRKSDLNRVWDEVHNLTHAGRNKT